MYQSRLSTNYNLKQPLSLAIPSCSICLKNYDNYYHIPRVLPKCGHTFCQKCIKSKLTNKRGRLTFICTQCETDVIIRKNVGDQLPKNITIADIVKDVRLKNVEEEVQVQGICKDHNKKLQMICISCKNLRICSHCAVFGIHKGHNISNQQAATNDDIKQLNQFLAVLEDTVNHFLLPSSPQNIQNQSKSRLVLSLQSYIKQNFRQYYGKISQKEAELLEQCQSIIIDQKAGQSIDGILTSYQILKLRGKDISTNISRIQIEQAIESSKRLHGEIQKIVQSYNKSIQSFLLQARTKIKQLSFFDIHFLQKRNLKGILKDNSSSSTKKQSKPKQNQIQIQEKNIKKMNSNFVSQYNSVEPLLLDKNQNKPKLINVTVSNPTGISSRTKVQRPMKPPASEPVQQQKNKNSVTTQNQPVQSRLITKNSKVSTGIPSVKKYQSSKTPDKLQKQRDKSPINLLTNQPIQLKFQKPTKQLSYQFRPKLKSITDQIDRQIPSGSLQLISLQINDHLIPYICDYLMSKKLKFSMLKFVKNNLTDEGFKTLLSYLSTDTYTKVLNVTNNQLTNKSLNYILTFITQNSILKTIYVSNNKINQIQVKKIQNILDNKFVQVVI